MSGVGSPALPPPIVAVAAFTNVPVPVETDFTGSLWMSALQ